MSLPSTLAAFALRHAVGDSAEKVISTLDRHFTDHSHALPKALILANDKAWNVVGLALAGDSLFDWVKDLLRGGDVTGLRDEIRAFLAITLTGLEASAEKDRLRACEEYGRLRKSGRLKIDLDTITKDMRRYSDPSKLVADTESAIATVADALAPDAPHLAAALRLAPPNGTPLFAGAFRYFFRCEVAKNEELFRALMFDSLSDGRAEQERGFELLAGRTAGLLDLSDMLLDEVAKLDEQIVIGFAAVKVQVDAGFAGTNAKLDALTTQLSVCIERSKEPRNPGVSYDSEELRILLDRTKQAYRQNAGRVSAEQQAILAEGLNVAGRHKEASEAHETAATIARDDGDKIGEAANHYKAYLDACDAKAWPRAYDLLWKAVELAPAQYRPFHHRYRPERILGGGAFGTVFHCHDEYDFDEENRPRPVAIKSFRAESLDRDLAKVFEEARILKALGHESIIRVIDQGFGDPETKSRPYHVLEYFPGQTLDQLGELPLSDFFVIARKIAAAIHAAHTRPRPIYHRDLKPSNVMGLRHADGTWTVKIIDFGLAVRAEVMTAGAAVSAAAHSTRNKSVTGTLKYAPPEQTGDLPGVPVGAYSDVYAFGKMCLNMLFRTPAPKSWDWKPLPDEIRRPLRELFEHCTAESLEHRFPNFEPVLKGLADLDPAEKANRQWAEHKVVITRQAEQTEAPRVAVEQRAHEDAAREAEMSRAAIEQQQQADVARQRKEADHSRQVEEPRKGSEPAPDGATLHIELGNALYDKGDLGAAEGEYKEAIKLDPASTWAFIGLGNVLSDKGDSDGAIAAYKEAIKLEPTNTTAHNNLRDALQEDVRKKAEEARSVPALQTSGDRAAGTKLKITFPGGVVMRFTWCPPGSFVMGSNHPEAAEPNEVYGHERPVHRVTLTKGFFMGIHPVTQAQWKAVMGTDPSYFKGPKKPVEQVSWDDCQEFCAKLTAHLYGRGTVRLPTEAEWEYACRAGTTTEYHFGDTINTDLANYNGNYSWNDSPKGKSREETTDVGSFPPNPWGLHDLHGNVQEWSADCYAPYTSDEQTDPSANDKQSSGYHALRGGSWSSYPNFCRAASRNGFPAATRGNLCGFRVCFRLDTRDGGLVAPLHEQQVATPLDWETFGDADDGLTDISEKVRELWEEAAEAILREDFRTWDSRWIVLREVASAEAKKLLTKPVRSEKNEAKLAKLPTDVRGRLRAACGDVGLLPPRPLLVPVGLGELEPLLGGPPDWAGYTAFVLMAKDELNWLPHIPAANRVQMRKRAREFLFAAQPAALAAYVHSARPYLDTDPTFLTALFPQFSPSAANLMDRLLAAGTLESGDWLKLCTAVKLTQDQWGEYLLESDRLASLLVGLGGDGTGKDVWQGYLDCLTPALVAPELSDAEGEDARNIHEWERKVHTHLRVAGERLTAAGTKLAPALPTGGVAKLFAANNLIKWVAEPATAERDGPEEVKLACERFGIDPLNLIEVAYRAGGYNQYDPSAEAQQFAPLIALFKTCFPVDHAPHTARRAARELIRLSQSCPANTRAAFQVRLLYACIWDGHYRALLSADERNMLQPGAVAWLSGQVNGPVKRAGPKYVPPPPAAAPALLPKNLRITCPVCKTELEIDSMFEGQEIECGYCYEIFVARRNKPHGA